MTRIPRCAPLVALPALAGLYATSLVDTPVVVIEGALAGPLDSFRSEIFVVEAGEIVAYDGAGGRRTLVVRVPVDVVAISWDPASRVCMASGDTLSCTDLLTGEEASRALPGRILDLQLSCTGVLALLADPPRIASLGASGAPTITPISAAIEGLAQGRDCASVGGWSGEALGFVSLAKGEFEVDTRTAGVEDASRSGSGWLVREGDTVRRLEDGREVRRWRVDGARRVAAWTGGATAAVLDAGGRVWALP